MNGKDLEGFKPDVTDYHLEYEGERPIVSAQGKNGTAVTVIDAKVPMLGSCQGCLRRWQARKGISTFSIRKAPTGSAIPEEGLESGPYQTRVGD